MPARCQPRVVFLTQGSTESDDETEFLLDAVGDIVRGQMDRPLSFRERDFQVEGVPIKLFKVLP